MQTTKNSHCIARHLTRPWEFGERKLWYYDFDTDSFDTQSSKSLYTADEPWDQAIEDFLNKYLESPLSNFLSRFNRDRTAVATEFELRAMKLTVLLQPSRCDDTIAEIALKGEGYINNLVMAADQVYSFVHVPLRQERLFCPDHGLIAIPFIGAEPALAVPFHPSYFTAAVRNPVRGLLRQIEALRENPEMITALSIGLDACRRVVIPSSTRTTIDEATMRQAIKESRNMSKMLTKAMLDGNSALLGTPQPTNAG